MPGGEEGYPVARKDPHSPPGIRTPVHGHVGVLIQHHHSWRSVAPHPKPGRWIVLLAMDILAYLDLTHQPQSLSIALAGRDHL